ncbi:MAG: catechol-2,3-dioxygenase [Lysobacterales bacterium]|jgi:catechol-2,3-dioxygenase
MYQPGALPKPAKERGKIAPCKLAHVVLRTSRYKKVIDFYKLLLEAEAMYQNQQITFLTYDEEHHRMAIANVPGLFPKLKALAGVDHFAFTFESLGDLLHMYQRVKSHGIVPIWCINHGGTISFYYEDPDHNVVEMQIDVFQSNEQIDEYLKGDDYNSNPIGVDLDPDELLRRFDAGETFEELIKREQIGHRHVATLPRRYLGWVHWIIANVAYKLGIEI